MPRFSNRSKECLDECHPDLQQICNDIIEDFDFTVLTGYRNEMVQMVMFQTGRSKVKYPHSKHNRIPSQAVDIAPYPIDWNDKKRFYYLAGLFKATAKKYGIRVRWGGDWDSDNDFADNSFDDLPHFELVKNDP